MKKNIIETIVGLLIIIIAVTFFCFAYNLSNYSRSQNRYALIAKFENIDGITKGSDIKLGGIKIGEVDELSLEGDSYYAKVTLLIQRDILIPSDSRAIISTNGLLGSKYIRISAGASDQKLSPGATIIFTQSALNIEDLIGKLMYSITSN